jgi:hypothetical protein
LSISTFSGPVTIVIVSVPDSTFRGNAPGNALGDAAGPRWSRLPNSTAQSIA